MKYFIDTEFIEGFHSVGGIFGHQRSRHHIDLISIAVIAEDGREYYEISSEYNYDEADDWVKENVIHPLYINTVHGDARNHCGVSNFHKHFGKPLARIQRELHEFFGYAMTTVTDGSPWVPIHDKDIQVYAYYADYDWVLFCSIFGRMIDLPEGMPMFCMDIKQMMQERGLTQQWKRDNFPENDGHDALIDARYNKMLLEEVCKHKIL